MQIIYVNSNEDAERNAILENMIESVAKFQKVMIVFDDSIQEKTLFALSEIVKKNCIVNKSHIKSVTDEIYNGYKLVIFLVTADSFLHFQYAGGNYLSIFVPQTNEAMPFLLDDEARYKANDNILILPKRLFDETMFASLQFNKITNKLDSILNMENNFSFETEKAVTMPNMIEECLKFGEGKKFFDVDILIKQKIDYRYLKLVDLILIDAFLTLLDRIKNNTLMLADIYKLAKDDESLIDKYFALFEDVRFLEILNLNYNNLNEMLKKSKQTILNCIRQGEFTSFELENIITATQKYISTADGYLPYLFLYNVV